MADVTKITLEDGRIAERRVSIDADGNEVIELYAEEKRPLKLEKKVVREYKKVLAKEVHQTIKDGEVVGVEEKANVVDSPLRVVEKVAVNDNSAAMEKLVSAMECLVDNMEVVKAQSLAPVISAQSLVEANVAEKEKSSMKGNLLVIALVAINVAYWGYVLFIR